MGIPFLNKHLMADILLHRFTKGTNRFNR